MYCDAPNNDLYNFQGVFRSSKAEVHINNENLLLRGMILRNTSSILGSVVYTGHESKIQMNNLDAKYKVSSLMHQMNINLFSVLAC